MEHQYKSSTVELSNQNPKFDNPKEVCNLWVGKQGKSKHIRYPKVDRI